MSVYAHGPAVLAALGPCSADPTCTAPAQVTDDDDPTVRRCARHALAAVSGASLPTPC